MRISNKKLKELIIEEKKASKEYKHYGFNPIAKQEARHARRLASVLKRRL